jgi:hypothetical protein
MAAAMKGYEQPCLEGLKDLREQIDNGTSKEFKSNWMRIPLGRKGAGMAFGQRGRLDVKEWYKREVASFVPHKICPGFIPYCPNCKKNDSVNVLACRWVNKPRILFGTDDYRFLDTKRYPCQRCNGTFFNAYDKASMQKGGLLIQSAFPFYLTEKVAIDNQLYCYLAERSNDSPASIRCVLLAMTQNTYIRAAQDKSTTCV